MNLSNIFLDEIPIFLNLFFNVLFLLSSDFLPLSSTILNELCFRAFNNLFTL